MEQEQKLGDGLKFKNFIRQDGKYFAIYVNGVGDEFEVRPRGQMILDLVAHIRRQQEFSFKTFGPLGQGQKPEGVIQHIEKECGELRQNPKDLKEWVDIIILGIDGATKAGCTPEQIVEALVAKQTRNESRTWPDWRLQDPNKAIEHVRTPEEMQAKAKELEPFKANYYIEVVLKNPNKLVSTCTISTATTQEHIQQMAKDLVDLLNECKQLAASTGQLSLPVDANGSPV